MLFGDGVQIGSAIDAIWSTGGQNDKAGRREGRWGITDAWTPLIKYPLGECCTSAGTYDECETDEAD